MFYANPKNKQQIRANNKYLSAKKLDADFLNKDSKSINAEQKNEEKFNFDKQLNENEKILKTLKKDKGTKSQIVALKEFCNNLKSQLDLALSLMESVINQQSSDNDE